MRFRSVSENSMKFVPVREMDAQHSLIETFLNCYDIGFNGTHADLFFTIYPNKYQVAGRGPLPPFTALKISSLWLECRTPLEREDGGGVVERD